MDLPLSLRMAKSVERRYRPGMMAWHYEHGLVLYASLRAADIHSDDTIYPWVYSMYDKLISSDGTIATYREGEYNLDQINAGKTLFALADRSGEERFSLAADRLHKQLVNHPRCKCGVFWHKEIYIRKSIRGRFGLMDFIWKVLSQLNTARDITTAQGSMISQSKSRLHILFFATLRQAFFIMPTMNRRA